MHAFGLTLLADAAAKGTLVLLAATGAAILLRRSSAANRHLVWQLALIAMLSLPIVKMVSPWRLPWLPQMRSPVVTPRVATERNAADQPMSALNAGQGKQVAPAAGSQQVQRNAPVRQAAAPAQASRSMLVGVLYWLGVVWLAVTVALLVRLLLGFVLVRWFALRGYPLHEDGWAELNSDLAALVGVRGRVQLYASPHIATPMTWG
ncbi:MAG TPA: hypothetical protein VF021_11510, partial [Longimicrobiales bacterium]